MGVRGTACRLQARTKMESGADMVSGSCNLNVALRRFSRPCGTAEQFRVSSFEIEVSIPTPSGCRAEALHLARSNARLKAPQRCFAFWGLRATAVLFFGSGTVRSAQAVLRDRVS